MHKVQTSTIVLILLLSSLVSLPRLINQNIAEAETILNELRITIINELEPEKPLFTPFPNLTGKTYKEVEEMLKKRGIKIYNN